MRTFEDLYAWAAERKGGSDALEGLFDPVKSPKALAAIPDDRWLSDMTRRVFQAGFNWSVIDNKWEGFEAAFDGFDPGRWTLMSDADLDRLVTDTRIVRHAAKIQSVRDNAIFIARLAKDHGSAGRFFGQHPKTDYVGLLDTLKKQACRMGGTTAQYFLRGMGVDSVIFTRDVAAALVREGVVDKAPTSKKDLAAAQHAFNVWMEESGRPLGHISRVLAFTVGD
ncbi:MAG: DNA-3-methyladenine glycosylase I [Pseudomonadota bacterium]